MKAAVGKRERDAGDATSSAGRKDALTAATRPCAGTPRNLLHGQANARSLAAFRIWVFGCWLLFTLFCPFTQLSRLPVEAFQPTGVLHNLPAAVWPWLLSAAGLWTIKLLLIATLLWSIVGGAKARAAMFASVGLLLLVQSLLRGFSGHINHGELPLWFAALVLACSPSLDAFAWRPENRRRDSAKPRACYAAPLQLMVVAFSLTYLFVGVVRLLDGGLPLLVSDSLQIWSIQAAYLPRFYTNDFGLLLYGWPPLGYLLTAGFIVVTIFEILSPLVLFSRRFRYAWLAVIIGFHVGTLLLMNIFFVHNLALLVVMIDFDRWFNAADRSAKRTSCMNRQPAEAIFEAGMPTSAGGR